MARDQKSYVNCQETACLSGTSQTNGRANCPDPLLHIIQLLARQAAQQDIAAQRSQPPSKE
ncbi:hypothetical protein RA24_16745 [Leisingera sp. ANG-M6]|nr:hypothetical protein RA24_16745 [Leisingera sp. ANG-M6]